MFTATLAILFTLTSAPPVDSVGRFEFDTLPDKSVQAWELANLEYPQDAIAVVELDKGNRAVRVGNPDGMQNGRYTIALRESLHDWSPTDPNAQHEVSVRFSANYSGDAFLAVAVPGASALVDIGHNRFRLSKRIDEKEAMIDETETVQRVLLGKWNAAELHTYTVKWKTSATGSASRFAIAIDGRDVMDFHGYKRELEFDSTLELSLENGRGTGLFDSAAWKINDGRPRPSSRFSVAKGVRQLFLDDAGIETLNGLKRVVNQPHRHPGNPVLKGEHPWEKASASVYGTMLYDQMKKEFRLWYLCSPAPHESGRKWVEVGGYRRANPTLLAYAVSPDAIHWTKPELNQLTFEGSNKNNLIDIGIDNPEGVSVLFDPQDADPQRRFKAFFWDRRLQPSDDPAGVDEQAAKIPVDPPGMTDLQRAGGMWVAFSPDGIRWKTIGPVLPQGSDTTHTLLFDPARKKYVGFGRMGFGRTVARTESDDAVTWTPPRLVLSCDGDDGPAGQIYGMPTDLYEGLYVGMFWMYREGTDAKIDTQLAVSRDGKRWQRVAGRQTFLANGPDGAWDDGMSRAGRAINVVGDTIYLHYSMVNGPHRSAKFPKPERKFPSAIGLVTLRRDGFVSLDAGDVPGTITTHAFELPRGTLHLNTDAANGQVTVAMLDSTGKTLLESQPIRGDHPRAAVQWNNDSTTVADATPVRLRIKISNAKLYSYWFEE